MSQQNLLLSEKYKAFIRHDADFEALEGVTAAGKTTVGIFKFMLKVAENPKKSHIIAAKTTGVAEKNIINKDLGIVDDFGALVEYNGNGNKDEKLPHILYHTNAGDKVIYILGYDTKDKWKNALGGQYGCLYIDEVNTADIDFVRETTMRADYTMVTLNPDALINVIFKTYDTLNKKTNLEDIEVSVPFGEYANPSFESQVETITKAKTGQIMSIEAAVDELYGDTKDEEWKKEEITRLKTELGIIEVDELSVSSELKEGDGINAGKSTEQNIQNE